MVTFLTMATLIASKPRRCHGNGTIKLSYHTEPHNLCCLYDSCIQCVTKVTRYTVVGCYDDVPSIRFSSSCVLATPVSRDQDEEFTIERSRSRSLSRSSTATSGFITFLKSRFLRSPAMVGTVTLVVQEMDSLASSLGDHSMIYPGVYIYIRKCVGIQGYRAEYPYRLYIYICGYSICHYSRTTYVLLNVTCTTPVVLCQMSSGTHSNLHVHACLCLYVCLVVYSTAVYPVSLVYCYLRHNEMLSVVIVIDARGSSLISARAMSHITPLIPIIR